MTDPYLYPHTDVLKNLADIKDANDWAKLDLPSVAKQFSDYMARLWKTHPFREENTRTVVTFCSQFIESKGFYISSDLFKDNAQYMRSALVAASAIFSDLGDRRKMEYLERIVLDALNEGQEMKDRVKRAIEAAGYVPTNSLVREIVYWNRIEKYEHTSKEVLQYLKTK